MLKTCLAAGVAGAVLIASASAERFNATAVIFEDVTATIEIVVNSGDVVDLSVEDGAAAHPIEATLDGSGALLIRGERWRAPDDPDCCNDRISRTVDIAKNRRLATGEAPDSSFFDAYPTLRLTVPRSADISFRDARVLINMGQTDGALDLDACYAYGEIGGAGEASIGVISGSRLVIGDIGGLLEIDVSGDADVLAGDAAMVDVDIAGPGDVIVGAVDGMLDASIAGSGSLRVAALDGPMTVRIAGSGIVAVQSGRADPLKATIDGSGGVLFEGEATRPNLRLSGSAEVRLNRVSGRLERAGGGTVYVGGNPLPE